MRVAILIPCLLLSCPAFAQIGPFGVGVPAEPQVGVGFDQLVAWTANAQGRFYEGLTGALRDVHSSGVAFWTLIGLSLLYGVVHAAGPGHGKVVIGSYMVATGDTARRGALLAIAAALLQATGAVALVGLAAGVLNLGQTVIAVSTITLERFSYGLIIAVGVYLMWRLAKQWLRQPAPLAVAGAAHAVAAPAHASQPHLGHAHGSHAHGSHAHGSHAHPHAHATQAEHNHSHNHHEHGPECGCNHAHMPDARLVGEAKGAGQMLAIVASAGLRPCTGAILVLVLAFSQGLFWQGAAAAYAMGLGTALTVGTLAVMAGSFSSLMDAYGAPYSPFMRAARVAVQLLAALVIISFGALLLAASLAR